MATMKDVAKLAGVSIGTVSNVINNVQTVSIENVRKVEAAIQSLGYKPNAFSQRAKSKEISSTVALVLPNITDEVYSLFYSHTLQLLRDHDFYLDLHITNDIPEMENWILERLRCEAPSAIILTTCQPDNTALFSSIKNDGLNLILFDRKSCFQSNYVGFDNSNLMESLLTQLFEKEIYDIALICGPRTHSTEQELEKAYRATFQQAGQAINESLLLCTDFSIQASFRAISQLIHSKQVPSIIIASSSIIGEGVRRALHYIISEKQCKLITLGDTFWKTASKSEQPVVTKPVYEAAKKVVSLVLSGIQNLQFLDYKDVYLSNSDLINLFPEENPKESDTVRLLTMQGDISAAIEPLIPYILENCRINVILDTVPYEKLYTTIYADQRSNKYDAYIFDVPWLHDFSANGILLDLTELVDRETMQNYYAEDRIIDAFARHEGRIYALPFMFTNQLLYYRKDLFSDYKNLLRFRQIYHVDLAPPTTWSEFNAVAKFFTRKYNPESQTEFGTTLGGQFSSAAHCEFMTRVWSYQDDIFNQNGNVHINTPNVRLALENYIESYQYASPTSKEHWWYEQVREFAAGDAAMMIMYSSHTAPLVDYKSSKVLGKIGYAAVPGGSSTFGGWSVGVSARTQNTKAVMRFIKYLCGKDLATPLTLLGCFSANRKNFMSNLINDIYPWTSMSIKAFAEAHTRKLPSSKQHLSYKTYEQIIAAAVRDCIIGKLTASEALQGADVALQKFLKQ